MSLAPPPESFLAMPPLRLLSFVLLASPLVAQERTSPEREDAVLRREALNGTTLQNLSTREALEARASVIERPSIQRSLVNVKGLTGELKDWQLTDMEGRDVKERLRPALVGDQLTLAPDALKQFVIKPNTVATRRVEVAEVMELPGGIVTARGEADAREPMSWFRLTFLASPLPAAWDPLSELYSTTVTFGLKRPADMPPEQSLDQPVRIRVSYDGLVGEEPPELLLGGPGLENERSFPLRFRPTTQQPTLRVRSTLSDVDLQLRAMSRLSLQALRSEVLGFGLEEAVLTVAEILPHGEQATRETAAPITISVEGRAQVEPDSIRFQPGPAQAQFRVRSAGLGPLPVTAQLGGLSAQATIQQGFPLGPLVAVLLGGALGGYARRFVKGGRRGKPGRRLTEGMVVAIVAFVAGVLGVGYLNVPAAVVATEAGAFLAGALSGFVGVVVLEKLSGALAAKPTG